MSEHNEYDLDLGALGRRLITRWWLILLLAVIGAALAAVIVQLRDATYEATSSVYLGQTTDANGNPVSSINANPRAAAQIVQTRAVLVEAAQRAGEPMTAARLRRGLEVEIPQQPARTSGVPNNLVMIHVSSGDPTAAARAANALARILARRMAVPAQQKAELLRTTIAADKRQLQTLSTRAEAAEEALAKIAASPASETERAALSGPYLTILQSVATLRESVAEELRLAQLQLLVARNVERPRVVSLASPPTASVGMDWGMAAAAGAFGGAVAGCLLALLWPRRRAS